MLKAVTIYPTMIPNPLLADVQHNHRHQWYVAVDNKTREVVADDVIISFLIDQEQLNGYFVGIDPSCNSYKRFIEDPEDKENK